MGIDDMMGEQAELPSMQGIDALAVTRHDDFWPKTSVKPQSADVSS
jgi:hypothetical protein